MITLNSVGHAFANAWNEIHKFTLGAETVIAKVESNPALQGVATGLAASIGGPAAADITRTGFAVLGELGSVLASGDAASKQHLLDAGLDQAVITQVEALITSSKSLLQSKGLKVV